MKVLDRESGGSYVIRFSNHTITRAAMNGIQKGKERVFGQENPAEKTCLKRRKQWKMLERVGKDGRRQMKL